MPNPNPITDNCNKYVDASLLNFGKGMSSVKAKLKPINNARGGVMKDVIQISEIATYKMPLNCLVFDENVDIS
jgi:hypothetical protein